MFYGVIATMIGVPSKSLTLFGGLHVNEKPWSIDDISFQLKGFCLLGPQCCGSFLLFPLLFRHRRVRICIFTEYAGKWRERFGSAAD